MIRGLPKHVHFVGIGGYGMSALALMLLDLGHQVSGSDPVRNARVERLVRRGCVFFNEQDGRHDTGAPWVVYSTAVRPDNPELQAARARGCRLLHRSELLDELLRAKRASVGVVGAHGKSTTTAMLAFLLTRAGLDPSFAVGGELVDLDANARAGLGEVFVAELDESDGSFERSHPATAILTNIDHEHVGSGNHYETFADLKAAYARFVRGIPRDGRVYFASHDPALRELEAGMGGEGPGFRSFGYGSQDWICASDVVLDGLGSSFRVRIRDRGELAVKLSVPGRHNVTNSLPVLDAGMALGIAPERVAEILSFFKGVKRRFEVIMKTRHNVWVVEDYGHHPAEIRATLDVAALLHRRVVAVFQPHRYSRTKELFDDFVRCFAGVDVLIVTEIYPASEPAIEGVSGQALYEGFLRAGYPQVHFAPDKAAVPEMLAQRVCPGDVVLMLGAGDIHAAAAEYRRRLLAQEAVHG